MSVEPTQRSVEPETELAIVVRGHAAVEGTLWKNARERTVAAKLETGMPSRLDCFAISLVIEGNVADQSAATRMLDRRNYSVRRLTELKERLESQPVIATQKNLCIYVSGSYGRLEASESSDLDLFFIDNDVSGKNRLNRLDEIEAKACVIRAARDLTFPEFTNEGEYLTTHSLKHMGEQLGNPADDHENLFTARLLLLLESRPICGYECYKSVLEHVIAMYYRDFHDHEKSFLPIFLLNDILRYWKTLCLNYEARRNRVADSEIDKSKHHLRNVKLKYSRLLTCFSMVIPLIARPQTTQQDVVQLVGTPPFDRLRGVTTSETGVALLDEMMEDYGWFLDEVKRDEILELLTDKDYRNAAFERGKGFADRVFRLLVECGGGIDALRYVAV